ncbi:MAG TPA: hypothetical protein PK280_04225 [Planctomycetota bacterium]|nr:hypothetical protein [Planctomycetota bacterium]
MHGRTVLVPVALLLALAAGCSSQRSALPERIELASYAGAPVAALPLRAGLAPSRGPAAASWETPGGPVLIGGMFWDPWGPFPDDASIVVDGTGVIVGWVLYVPGFALGAVISVLTLPIPTLGLTSFTFLPFKVGEIFGMVGYYVMVVPLYTVQKVCWDAPCALVRFIRLHSKSYKGQVDWLIPRHEDSPYGKQVQKKLKKLTGEDFGSREAWEKWWSTHRDEFDEDMDRVKPAAPEAKPAVPAAPAPAPAVQ